MEQPIKQAEAIKSSLLNGFVDGFEKSLYFTEHIKEILAKRSHQDLRLLRAFPKLKSLPYEEAWQKLKNRLLNSDK
ncbi:hypothetical protein SDC9_197426 [bioreactor metagenome]|uniref:Uncharacterized protein n=1 Tax=bioreactor metagenome TaxID=1076179 RepID=A0A645IN95_9ZZZZ